MFGGVGSAALTPLIASSLGYIAWKQHPENSIEAPRLTPRLWILLGLFPSVLSGGLMGLSFHGPYFGVVAFAWPIWLLVLLECTFGSSLRKRLNFPVLFLWFALPMEPLFFDLVDTPLQEWTASIAVFLLNSCGFAVKFWNAHTFYSDAFYIIVDETCSGMNLLVTLSMYALVFGWATQQRNAHRCYLVLSVLPLALISNGVRVGVIYLLGLYGGEELAKGGWHELSGVLAFAPTLLVIYALGVFLRRKSSENASDSSPR